MSIEDFKTMVSKSYSISELVRKFKFKCTTGNAWKAVSARIKKDNVDTSHFRLNGDPNKPKAKPAPLKKLLIKNSTAHRGRLKKKTN